MDKSNINARRQRNKSETLKPAPHPRTARAQRNAELGPLGKQTCSACDRELPLEAFNRCRKERFGRFHRCRECTQRILRSPRFRSYHRSYKQSAKAQQKDKARNAVEQALLRGDMTRKPCERCRATPAEAHHHAGYDRANWLTVKWLCRACHIEAHHPAIAS